MTPQKPKLREFFYAGAVLAFLVGTVLVVRHAALDTPHMIGAAIIITALAYFILVPRPKLRAPKRPAWVPESEASSIPRYGSRRWARANFHSGIISIEELNAFCASNHERLDDPDR